MPNIKWIAFTLLLFTSQLSHSGWISQIDIEYRSKNPQLYKKVQEARDLIEAENSSGKEKSDAIYMLLSVIKNDDSFAPAYVQIARAISKSGYKIDNKFTKESLSSQEEYLNTALEIEPNYDYALAFMGYTQMFKNNLYSAEKYYERAKKVDTGYPYLQSQLAQLQTKFGNLEAAIKIATAGYETHKDDPKIASSMINEIIMPLSRIPYKTEELNYWYKKRVEIYPESAWNWGDYAYFRLYMFGDYENAIKYSEKALSIKNYGHARFVLAASHYKKWSEIKDESGKSDEAEESFKIATKSYPNTRRMITKLSNKPRLANTAKDLKALYH